MASRTTSIEWTERTWNPFVGCSVKSPGCTNCYAMKLAVRLEAFGQSAYVGTTQRGAWTGRINHSSEAVRRKPLTVREPATFFVNSMSDFWHDNAEDAWRGEALAVMTTTPHHTYQILTKRPENIAPILARMGTALPPNVWLGATVEDGRVTERIDQLRAIPAVVRFLSVEPLIGAIDAPNLAGIDWVITGGESGPRARFCNPDWVRLLRDLCLKTGVAFFHKQWGHYRSNPLVCEGGLSLAEAAKLDTRGKGGALLDGHLWREMPQARRAGAPPAASHRSTMTSHNAGSISTAQT